jgi:hypothetical protein
MMSTPYSLRPFLSCVFVVTVLGLFSGVFSFAFSLDCSINPQKHQCNPDVDYPGLAVFGGLLTFLSLFTCALLFPRSL